ncbi:MAG: formylglycine-generating enzyme family protein, partial [Planctomycetota bacterium]
MEAIELSASDARDAETRLEACKDSLGKRFANYDQVAELLGNPAVLAMVRGLLQEDALATFQRRGDLYEQTSRQMLKKAASRLDLQLSPVRIKRAEAVLAAIACQMMVDNPELYRIAGDDEVEQIIEEAGRRLPRGITDKDLKLVAMLTGLTNQSLLYGASREVLGWHHKGMMEFYCGLHLARNEQAKWRIAEVDQEGHRWPKCGDPDIQRAASNPQWYWAFRFAIELKPLRRKDSVLLAAISTLFRPVSASDRSRPTELMCRAWSLLEQLPPHQWCDAVPPKLLAGGSRIIERFRQEFTQLCSKSNPDAESRKLALRLQWDEARDQPDPDPNNREPNKTREGEYRRIPDRGDQASFKGERPKRVTVSPFWLRKFVVTNAEYRLFDGAHVSASEYSSAGFNDHYQPAVSVDWFMATMYCRWLGEPYRLPTEAEWEAACRAGSEMAYWFSNEEELKKHAWYGEDWRKGSTHRWQESRDAGGHENPWGLYDMHGNV